MQRGNTAIHLTTSQDIHRELTNTKPINASDDIPITLIVRVTMVYISISFYYQIGGSYSLQQLRNKIMNGCGVFFM